MITAVSPSGTAGSTVQVSVTTDAGTSSNTLADNFTYYAVNIPTITSVSPSSGPYAGGTTVYIYGSNFTADSVVYFGYSAATSVSVSSSTLIIAVSPSGSAGSTVQVSVATGAGTSADTSVGTFTYYALDGPTITYISPDSGSEGDTVTILGSNFDYASVEVYFGNFQAEAVTYLSSTELLAVAPAGTDGSTVRVAVVTDYGTSPDTWADYFTYYAGAAPTIAYISPDSGWAGDTVTILGSNLDGPDLAVYFGGVPAAGVSYISSTELMVGVPAGVSGSTVRVAVVTDYGTSPDIWADYFTYN
jgi:hypothetical protein